MSRCLLAFILLLPWLAFAQPVAMRMCVDAEPHLPYLTPTLGGSAGELVSRAARHAGVHIALRQVPLARCRAELNADKADATPALPFRQMPFMVYPMRGDDADASAAVGSSSFMVFRRVGTKVGWNGKQFSDLHTPALLVFGSMPPLTVLARLGVPADDNAKTVRANFEKLLAGRADVCIAFRKEGQALLALPEFVGKIEMLPLSLTENRYYLSVTARFYRANKAAVEAMWQSIRRDNATRLSVQAAETRMK